MKNTTASGPTMAGGTQPIVTDGYELLFLPDVHNNALQMEGKAPVFYWLPNLVRIARKHGQDQGDFLFNLIRFAGVQSAEGTVGAEGNREVAGGVLTFTVTSAPPDHVLQQSQDKIIEQYRASSDFFWGIRTNVPPMFRPVPIVSNVTVVSNVSPLPDGSVPGTGAGTPRAAGGLRDVRSVSVRNWRQRPRTVPANRDNSTDSNLDAWFWHMQGQGNGSIDPMGQNAYSALLGAYPTAILWQAFHGTSSPIVVAQNLKIKMWAPLLEIHIRGDWKKMLKHFSAQATGRYLWFSADIKAEMNKLRTEGLLTVEVLVDPTIPGAQAIQETVDKKTDLVFNKFIELAMKVIFDPPPPTVTTAETSSSTVSAPGGTKVETTPWSAGLAVKARFDETRLGLEYHEKREMAFLQETIISSSLEGMLEEMKSDPQAEKKYFRSCYLDGWPLKLGRIFKPVVNWPKPEQNWAGQPVAFVSCQVGYPNTNGEIMWTGHAFQKTDPPDASWPIGFAQKDLADVTNPPSGWSPDMTFIKRRIHLLEPPSVQENPFVRVQVAQNTIDLDPEPNGSLMNDINIEVRADSAGALAVGPIALNVELEDSKQSVEVLMEPTDPQGNSLNGEIVRFNWGFADQAQPRFWAIFTGDRTVRPFYRYKAIVTIKGSLFTQGMSWEGPWEEAAGNGPLMVRVRSYDDPEVVTKRELPSFLATGSTSTSVTSAGSLAPPPSREHKRPDELEVSGWSTREPEKKQARGSGRPAPPPSSGMAPSPSHGVVPPPSGGSIAPPAVGTSTPPGGEITPSKESRELEMFSWRIET